MILSIDIGNSRIKVGCFEQDELKEVLSFDSSDHPEFINLIKHAEDSAISSVRSTLPDIIQQIPDNNKLVISHTTSFPFQVNYKTPETLGIDRLCLCTGAVKLFPHQDVLIIDMGTCITYDLVTRANTYMGGGISPGMHMRLKSMKEFTERLPLVPPADEPPIIGDDTTSSLQFGAMRGIIAEMDGIIVHFKRSYPELKVILTGGDAPQFEQHFINAIFAAPNLQLEGIYETLRFNRENT